MKSHQDPPAPPEAAASNTTVVPANANAAAKESTAAGTNVIAGANNATNAVGHIGPNTHSVTDSPYKITSCDQVLLIDGLQTITDYKDYCVKAPVYFTLNVYFVNLFESKDSAKLTNSISFDKLRFPTIMEGAKGCVLFQNSQTLNRLPICGTEEQANQIIEAYKSFLDCRAGDNLKESVPKSSAPVQLNQLDPALQAAAMAAAGEELVKLK